MSLPKQPVPLKEGMSWDMNANYIHIFFHDEPVMTISISEVIAEQARLVALPKEEIVAPTIFDFYKHVFPTSTKG